MNCLSRRITSAANETPMATWGYDVVCSVAVCVALRKAAQWKQFSETISTALSMSKAKKYLFTTVRSW